MGGGGGVKFKLEMKILIKETRPLFCKQISDEITNNTELLLS